MILKEANYRKRIADLSRNNWKPLLELIPEIQKTKKFIEQPDETPDEGVIPLDLTSFESQIIHKFREATYEIPIIIDFNWAKWDEGKKMVSDETFDYDTIDIPTKCKIITAIVRNDRFCSGRLASAFESGLILKVLQSIEHQLKEING